MAVDILYHLAEGIADRKFSLICKDSDALAAFSLEERGGIEERIQLGNLIYCSGSDFLYGEMPIAVESLQEFLRRFCTTLSHLESYAYFVPLVRSSIPEFERLLQGQHADIAIIRRAYRALTQEPFSEQVLNDRKLQEILLQGAYDCSETDPERTDRILIDQLYPMARIWKQNRMFFTPLSYYLTPDEDSDAFVFQQFRQQLNKFSSSSS